MPSIDIILFVDDLLVACERDSTVTETKNQWSCPLKMRELGDSRVILGIEIIRNLNSKTVFLTQSRYARKVVKRFGMEPVKGFTVLMDVEETTLLKIQILLDHTWSKLVRCCVSSFEAC